MRAAASCKLQSADARQDVELMFLYSTGVRATRAQLPLIFGSISFFPPRLSTFTNVFSDVHSSPSVLVSFSFRPFSFHVFTLNLHQSLTEELFLLFVLLFP